MKLTKLVSLGKALAVAVIVLGIVHDAATFTPLISEGLDCLAPVDLDAIIFMSLVCGASFILSGVLLVLLIPKIEQFNFLIAPIIVLGIFLAISGVFAVFYMSSNPFAWISLVVNACMFILTVMLKLKLRVE